MVEKYTFYLTSKQASTLAPPPQKWKGIFQNYYYLSDPFLKRAPWQDQRLRAILYVVKSTSKLVVRFCFKKNDGRTALSWEKSRYCQDFRVRISTEKFIFMLYLSYSETDHNVKYRFDWALRLGSAPTLPAKIQTT